METVSAAGSVQRSSSVRKIKTKTSALTELSEFRASGIYAEGWNAARSSLESSRNPYLNEPERSRWDEGYTQGNA
jgi:hypothetical protein